MYPRASNTCSHTRYILTHHKHVHLYAIPHIHTCAHHPCYKLHAYTQHSLPQHTQTSVYIHTMCSYSHTAPTNIYFQIHVYAHTMHTAFKYIMPAYTDTCHSHKHGSHIPCVPKPCPCPQAHWKVPQSLTVL